MVLSASRSLTLLALAAALAGCASTPPRFHSLLPQQPAATSTQQAAFGFEMLPIDLPLSVDQPQLLLRHDEALTPLYAERWASPLADEVQAAISYELERRLGAPDITRLGAPATLPVWRIQTDIRRFEMGQAQPAILEANWRLRAPSGNTLLCNSHITTGDAGTDVLSVVQTQRATVLMLAQAIASAISRQGAAPVDQALARHVCSNAPADKPAS